MASDDVGGGGHWQPAFLSLLLALFLLFCLKESALFMWNSTIYLKVFIKSFANANATGTNYTIMLFMAFKVSHILCCQFLFTKVNISHVVILFLPNVHFQCISLYNAYRSEITVQLLLILSDIIY